MRSTEATSSGPIRLVCWHLRGRARAFSQLVQPRVLLTCVVGLGLAVAAARNWFVSRNLTRSIEDHGITIPLLLISYRLRTKFTRWRVTTPVRGSWVILATRGRGGLTPGQQSQGGELGSAPWGAKGRPPDLYVASECSAAFPCFSVQIGIAGCDRHHRVHCRMAAAVNTKRKSETFEPVTMGDIRAHGVTRLLVYCESLWCHHCATLDADWLPDDVILLDLNRRMICTACGSIGADVRPDWSQHTPAAAPGKAISVTPLQLRK